MANVPSVAASASPQFRKADRYQSALFGHLIPVRYTFRLRKAIPQQPRLAFQIGRGVSVECFVAVKQDFSFKMQVL